MALASWKYSRARPRLVRRIETNIGRRGHLANVFHVVHLDLAISLTGMPCGQQAALAFHGFCQSGFAVKSH